MNFKIKDKNGIVLKTNKKYCKEDISVGVETEELNIVPNTTEQINEGLFNKVTVAGDSNLVSENIKEGIEIFGIEGNAKTTSAKITDGYYLFYENTRLDCVYDILKLCDNITNTSRMFQNCNKLTNLDLSNFNTNSVTNMNYMFYGCSNLTDLNLSNFNTSKVTIMTNMFSGCSSLTNLDLSNFNTSNVTKIDYMFYGCKKLTELNLSNFNTNKVINMAYMFGNCSSLTNLDLSSFNTSNTTDMTYMFHNCSSLIDLDLSNFNTSNITSMYYMFNNCSSLTDLNLSNFNTSKVTSMYYTFYNCTSLTDLDLSSFDMSKVTSINSIFVNCGQLINLQFGFNLGKGYTQKSANYRDYKLDLSSCVELTHESLMSVINNLYDLKLRYNVAGGGKLYTQTLNLGNTNLAKLTAEEIAIATNKGWNVS